MKCQNTINYLNRFDEILNQMADKMLSAEPTDSITTTFIQCMIPHHQAAIYMCENLLKYTMCEPLEKIAKDIIRMQTIGIEQMRVIYNTTEGYNSSQNDIQEYYEEYLKITKNMIEKMKNAPRCENINLNFINEMIPHHEGAIEMCNNLLKYRIDPRLKEVAESIIKEQSEGVEELKTAKMDLCS